MERHQQELRRRFLLDINANPIEFRNGVEVGDEDDEEYIEYVNGMDDEANDVGEGEDDMD